MQSTMHMSSRNCLEWRTPPCNCRMLVARQHSAVSRSRHGLSTSTAAAAAQQQDAVVVPIPDSKEAAVSVMGKQGWLDRLHTPAARNGS
jgi:hypothetical protein